VGEDGKVHLLQKREQTELGSLLAGLRTSEIDRVGASHEVAVAIRKSGRIVTGRAIVREAAEEKWLDEGVGEFVADSIGTD